MLLCNIFSNLPGHLLESVQRFLQRENPIPVSTSTIHLVSLNVKSYHKNMKDALVKDWRLMLPSANTSSIQKICSVKDLHPSGDLERGMGGSPHKRGL